MRVVDFLGDIGDVAGNLCAVLAFLALIIKPIREFILGTKKREQGIRCLLRAEIVHIYYKNRDTKTLREYEYKNLEYCYKAYKKYGGNSFVDRIYSEMQEWEVVS